MRPEEEASPPEIVRPRRAPPQDPFFAASRFAWLYATIQGLGGVLLSLFAVAGVVPPFAAVGQWLVVVTFAALARRIREGTLWAANVAAWLVVALGVASVASIALIARKNPLLLIHTVLPTGITIAIHHQLRKPARAAVVGGAV